MPKYNYNHDKVDSWYRYKGVTPPSRTPNMTEDELHDALKESARSHSCVYEQMGNEIFCETGEYRHGKIIGSAVRLDGTKNGEPILVPVGPILRSDIQSA